MCFIDIKLLFSVHTQAKCRYLNMGTKKIAKPAVDIHHKFYINFISYTCFFTVCSSQNQLLTSQSHRGVVQWKE